MNPFAIIAKKKSTSAPAGPIFIRAITVDKTKVPSDQTNFTALVSFTNAKLKTVANGGHVQRSDGFDIGFYSSAILDTKLKWEMESYDGATGTVVAWVKVASLSSSSATVFYMSYGDAAITTDQSDPANVWDSDYVGVYHLGNGTTLSVNSSTGTNNGTNHGVTAVAGKVDGGGNFVNLSSQYIDLGNGMNNTAVSYSAWIKFSSLAATYNPPISRTDGGVFSGLYIKAPGKLNASFFTTAFVGYDAGTHTLSAGTFYHVAVGYDSVNGAVGYVNGAIDGSAAATGNLNTLAVNTAIGREATGSAYWNGVIDEVRISKISRSADWVLTEYNNQNSPGTFITVGPET